MDLIFMAARARPSAFFWAVEIGFVWDGARQGWIRGEVPPLRMHSATV